MGTETMDKVVVSARIENLEDLYLVKQGIIPTDAVRRVAVDDAWVDTGASILSMPKRLVRQLGLCPLRTQRALTSTGFVVVQVYGSVRLAIQGRECPTDVIESPDDGPVRIGRVLLVALDFVVDPVGQRLIGNPEHGGEHIMELY